MESDQPIEIPEIECCGYLIDYLYEIGPTLPGTMGEGPLTHTEIAAWQFNTGVRLRPWESRVMQRLSLDYLIQAQKSITQNCPPPFGKVARRAAVAKKIDEVFG